MIQLHCESEFLGPGILDSFWCIVGRLELYRFGDSKSSGWYSTNPDCLAAGIS